MPKYCDIEASTTYTVGNSTLWSTNYLVQTPAGVLYKILPYSSSNVLAFVKSSDGGLTWTNPVTINAGQASHPAVWYDKWSGLAGGLIHLAYTNTTSADLHYRTIDTENSDTLSTETVVFAGASVASGGAISIARMRGGNVLCRGVIDNAAEGGVFKLADADVPNGAWSSVTINEALAANDHGIMLPGWAADTQDGMLLFWDVTANEISTQLYDDSGNSWSETSISTGMGALISAGNFNHAAFVDLANSQNCMIAWTDDDILNADLKCWTVTESTITAKTDVVLNSVDDQGFCAFSIDAVTGYWYAFYGGKSDGSETFSTDLNFYMKISQDSGATWGAETRVTQAGMTWIPQNVFAAPLCYAGGWRLSWMQNNTTTSDRAMVTLPVGQPRASNSLGGF